MQLTLPDFSLVLLIGASGAGKSTFAAEHFLPTEVISSDHCRGLVTDDENALDANQDAFEVLHFLARKRLQRRRLTVIDATNVQPEARKPLLQLAREHHCLAVAIVFELPDKVCLEHNERRPDRQLPARVIRAHGRTLRRSLRGLKQEGFQRIFRLRSDEEVTAATLERQPLWNDRRDLAGPFDVIGDIHGCLGELVTLLETLGWAVQRD